MLHPLIKVPNSYRPSKNIKITKGAGGTSLQWEHVFRPNLSVIHIQTTKSMEMWIVQRSRHRLFKTNFECVDTKTLSVAKVGQRIMSGNCNTKSSQNTIQCTLCEKHPTTTTSFKCQILLSSSLSHQTND